MSRWSGLASAVLLACLSTVAFAQGQPQEPNRGGVLDVASEDVRVALQRITPAPGFEVNLFASEEQFPELGNPLAMTFDPQGRLWVLTSPTYPHYLPGEPPDDKLVILEDTNRDGRADTLTVFADGLYVPMGFELGDGGVYVSQQPNLVFLRDTNGDGRADERRIILHGFGTEDSHHALSAFQWGPGGGLYFQEGTFLHSQVETPYGPVRVDNAAVFRYEPRTEKLSVFVSYPFANPWGHVIDRWGQNFISDASGGSNYFGTAFSGHVDYPNKQRPMKEWTLTKVRPTSGVEFIRSRHFPDEVQGHFIINNVIGFHGTKQYRVVEEGSGFVGIEVEPLLQSSDINFRPVAMQFGPDGALYVVDWFNPLIGHMQFSIRDPRRDRTHGRVWRVTAKGRPLLERPRIVGQPIEAQLELLKAYEDRTRYWTRLALREQPTSAVVRALRTWVEGLDRTHADYEHHLLEALWVYQHHDVVEQPLLRRLLEAKEFRARAAAVRVLHHWLDRVDDGLALVGRAVKDPEPRVRLEAVRALSFVSRPEAAEMALEVLRQPTDYYLQYALDSTITTLEKAWKPAMLGGRRLAADNPEGLAYLLARLRPAELTALPRSEPVFHELLSRAGVEPQFRGEALEGLAASSGRPVIEELLDAVRRIDGAPGSSGTSRELVQLLAASDPAVLVKVRPSVERLALNGRHAAVRQGAWVALMRADGSSQRAWLGASVSPRSRIDLLDGTALFSPGDDAALLSELYAPITSLLQSSTGPAARPPMGHQVSARYVRVVLPGRDRTLQLAEVEVRSAGTNIARAGTATQSSTVSSGAIGGHAANAIDGRMERTPQGAGVSFTSQEQDPWWELDLGSVQLIDAVVVHQEAGSRAGALYVSLLDAAREPVHVVDGLPAGVRSHTIALSGADVPVRLREAALAALPRIVRHHRDSAALLATFIRQDTSRGAAIDAMQQIPAEAWPAGQLPALADTLLAHTRAIPAGERSGTDVKQMVAFGRQVAARLPSADARRLVEAFDDLTVRVIRIEAVPSQMRFDIEQFAVEAGEEVEIVFVNPDHMPHNLIVTAQGALEDVSLRAEAMAAGPDGFQKHFVPDTPNVLHATPLINHNETARLRFTAPTQTGGYPYVCTFPGHWRTMNGTMQVVRAQPPSP
jgi:glucose/arabinose dehydrogenase/azurin